MIFEALLAKAAGLSLLAKTGVAAAAVATATAGAGLAGALPDAGEDAFDRVASPEIPVEVPADPSEVDLPDVELPTPATERPDPEPSEVQEVPGEDGRATAEENAGENGAEGRAIASQAAEMGRAFGERRAADAQALRDTAPPVPGTAADARELAEEAANGIVDDVRGAVPTPPEVDTPPVEAPPVEAPPVDTPPVEAPDSAPAEVPAGSAETADEATSNLPDGRP
jgi:hypothetical protein